jgi:hypothetical protein
MGVAGELHQPWIQIRPAWHELVQEPQCRGFVWRSKQPAWQLVWPVVHSAMHWPCEQNLPDTHLLLQIPQLLLSVCAVTHWLSHLSWSDAQMRYSGTSVTVGRVVMMVVETMVVTGTSNVGAGVGGSVSTITYDPPGNAVGTGVGAGVAGFPAADRIAEPVSIGYPIKVMIMRNATSPAATSRPRGTRDPAFADSLGIYS